MAEHTPTPWEVAIEDSDGDNFTRSIYGEGFKALLIARVDQHAKYVDADFIVKAVNSYDALVEALSQALTVLGPISNAADRADRECDKAERFGMPPYSDSASPGLGIRFDDLRRARTAKAAIAAALTKATAP